MNITRYSKAIAAACGAISIAVADGIFDLNDAVTVVLAVVAAFGFVYVAPANTDGTNV